MPEPLDHSIRNLHLALKRPFEAYNAYGISAPEIWEKLRPGATMFYAMFQQLATQLFVSTYCVHAT